MSDPTVSHADRYRDAGVDLTRGYDVVRRIADDVKSTARPGSVPSLGRFGGLFDLATLGYQEPILVSGTDGVGTKLFIAFAMDRHDTIGIDAVAMCVNDVVVQGAEPLFMLDYLALPRAEPDRVAAIVSGIARACRETNCALIGGETAEMTALYADGHYDIAGFAVGVVERSRLITGDRVKSGDLLVGLASSGFHSNGYTLLRQLYFEDLGYTLDHKLPDVDQTLGEMLLTPTRLYVKPILALLDSVDVHGMCHITGGGFYENIPRMSPTPHAYRIDRSAWPVPPCFTVTARLGAIDEREMFNVFNMGIGFIVALDECDWSRAHTVLRAAGVDAYAIGHVAEGNGVWIA